ncbi:hypothetical protein [Agrobacterium sp. V1]|uniref:hypothetical protein n=1 Tax=Agrobacterium sp. V1 TaxID=3061957 RepID=UPI002671FE1B|nr:hypothetical protein [Agrobacterium sp. V1]MDO3441377.1 hypothetical protein [Agrobacterium sp. V1]
MHNPLTENAVAQYIAEQTDELISLVSACPSSERIQFLVYLLDMVRSQAKEIYDTTPKPVPTLVYSTEKNHSGQKPSVRQQSRKVRNTKCEGDNV